MGLPGVFPLRIATWNLNNRVGKVRFRIEAADAAAAIGADVLVFTEFFPQQHEEAFRATLQEEGWPYQIMSAQPPEVANRILVASKVPVGPWDIPLPSFDHQFAANLLGFCLPVHGLSVLCVRVPAYKPGGDLLARAWEWLESAMDAIKESPAIVLGDLNVSPNRVTRSGRTFRRILDRGWDRAAAPGPGTYFGHNGNVTDIDHILATRHCRLSDAECVTEAGGFVLAGSKAAISDHAALMCAVELVAPHVAAG